MAPLVKKEPGAMVVKEIAGGVRIMSHCTASNCQGLSALSHYPSRDNLARHSDPSGARVGPVALQGV